MILFRLLAWLLILAGIGALGYDVIAMLANGTGTFEPVVFARLWLWIDQSSQLGINHFLEQSLGAGFNQAVLVPYLWGAPAFAVLLVPGILLRLLFRRRG